MGSRLAASLCTGILLASLAIGHAHPGVPSTTPLHPGQKSAAIVDQLGATAPNPAFLEEATTMLEAAGYVVDYYPAENITVAFYRDLPSRGHQLILLRNHATATSETKENESIYLFTSQKLLNRASLKGMPEGVRLGRYSDNLEMAYSVIGDRFVRQSMRGDFNGAVVINMGCEGAKNDSLADAFLQRGAEVYVGWDSKVTAEETDNATLALLEGYVSNQVIGDAVRQATLTIPGLARADAPNLLWATLDLPQGSGSGSLPSAGIDRKP